MRKRKIINVFVFFAVFIIFNLVLIISARKTSPNIPNHTNTNESINESTKDEFEENIFSKIERSICELLGLDYNYTPPKNPLYVKKINLAPYDHGEEPFINLINTTSFKVDLEKLIEKNFTSQKTEGEEPLVLIIHTHGTESFVPGDKNYYFENTSFNNTDTNKNIVAVGDAFCEILDKNGIPYIHDRTMYDENSYRLAYRNSGAAVEDHLEKYPSIRYVIDMHRDTITDKNNVNQKPVTTINGKSTAQIMFVVGTDAGGADHPNWKENLSVVIKYQEIINEKYPTLARPIYLHTSSFNQFNMPTMMLLEVGASGNTLEEAKNAAYLVAECLVDLIYRY